MSEHEFPEGTVFAKTDKGFVFGTYGSGAPKGASASTADYEDQLDKISRAHEESQNAPSR